MIARKVDGHTIISLDIDEVKRLCRLGAGAETCIWLVCGGKGFECLYYNRNEGCNLIGETLQERWEKGLTVAKRDGCDEIKRLEEGE
ncbi:unnamed protein product [marine sediment metagenome]|uniref:Uncharacterized protein n=1 Tax=marine sediment metagenome TaxID=412755 RepID=X1VYM2_9ZZZZ